MPTHEADFVSDQRVFDEMYGHTSSFFRPGDGSPGIFFTCERQDWLVFTQWSAESELERIGHQVVECGVDVSAQGGER